MKLFSSNLNYLGVDIGSAGIKMVELKNENGRPRLMTYGFIEEPIDIVHNSSPEMRDKTAALLLKILEASKASSKKAVVALQSFSVFSSIISLPPMNKKEIAQAVEWQAKKFVPLPLDQMTLDWKLLEIKNQADNSEKEKSKTADSQTEKNRAETKKETSGKNLKILIAAAPKKLVLRYVDVFKKAKLELLSLETENFALERSLVGGSPNPIMIVDIGAITTDISVVEGGIPFLSRSVDSGGEVITQAIMNGMHIDRKRAEQFKRDIGFSAVQGSLPKVIETAINPVINEIKYSFDLYASQQSQQKIEKIILTGGSAFLPKITDYLSKLLNIKVLIGDPWARVIYPTELKPVLDNLAPRFSVAVGLAMREIV